MSRIWIPDLLLTPLFILVTGRGGEGDEAVTADRGKPASWAVVLGITDYQDFPPLENSVSRAEGLRGIFSRTWRVPDENMRLLLNEAATHDAGRESPVNWLPGRVPEGDEVLVFLSGYGSTVEDIAGDEEDGLDEGFSTVDALEDSYARHIVDDPLSVWMDALRTERVTLIVEGDRFGQGDHDPDHLGHAEHAQRFSPKRRCR